MSGAVQPAPPRRLAPLLALPGLLGLLGLAALAGGCREPRAEAPVEARPLPVETLRVRASDGYGVQERFAGRVVARRASDLGFERPGRIQALHADEGDRVEEGQVLAELDTRSLRARRRELRAQVSETEARLALARLTLRRRDELAKSESISAQRYDEARTEVDALEARLAAARAGLEALVVDLSLSELHAPYAGSVVAREADEGSIVSPGQRILHVIETGVMEARIGVPTDTAASLELGTRYAVEVGGAEHPAVLHALVQAVDPGTRTVTAVLRFPEPDAALRHGDLARVSLERFVSDPGFWLPLSALAEGRRGLWTAYALAPAEGADAGVARVERRELQVVHTEADRVYVRGTLEPGDRVVATGLHRLVPGMSVRAHGSGPSPAPRG